VLCPPSGRAARTSREKCYAPGTGTRPGAELARSVECYTRNWNSAFHAVVQPLGLKCNQRALHEDERARLELWLLAGKLAATVNPGKPEKRDAGC